MHVSDVMTRQVVVVRPDTPMIDVARVLLEQRIGAVPVLDEGVVVGIVARSDLLAFDEDPDRGLRTAADVMSKDVMVLHEAMSVAVAARALARRGVKRAPVLRTGKLVGIVSESDLLRSYARADADLVIDVERVLRAPAVGAHLEPIGFSVAGGIVTLSGAVRGEPDRAFAVRLVRSIQGVADVDDRLTLAEDAVDAGLTGARRGAILP